MEPMIGLLKGLDSLDWSVDGSHLLLLVLRFMVVALG